MTWAGGGGTLVPWLSLVRVSLCVASIDRANRLTNEKTHLSLCKGGTHVPQVFSDDTRRRQSQNGIRRLRRDSKQGRAQSGCKQHATLTLHLALWEAVIQEAYTQNTAHMWEALGSQTPATTRRPHLTRRNQVASGPVAELVEDAVTVRLLHLGMDVEARVAQLRDFLRQELHPCSIKIRAGQVSSNASPNRFVTSPDIFNEGVKPNFVLKEPQQKRSCPLRLR